MTRRTENDQPTHKQTKQNAHLDSSDRRAKTATTSGQGPSEPRTTQTSSNRGNAKPSGGSRGSGRGRGTARDRSQKGEQAVAGLLRIDLKNKQLRELTDEALSALIRAQRNDPRLCVSAGGLVLVDRDALTGSTSIRSVAVDVLRGELTRAANFYDKPGKGGRDTFPPRDIVRDLLAQASWPFPRLAGLVSTPVMRHDGTILATTGYDEATGLYYAPTEEFNSMKRVPTTPTAANMRQAKALIDDLLAEFPYVGLADRANMWALLLTPCIRPLVDLVPLALLDAPQAGSGKTLQADVIAAVFTGKRAEMSATPRNEAEWIKMLSTLLDERPILVVFDNIKGELTSQTLAMALTSAEIQARKLGTNKMLKVPNTVTWIATANAVRVDSDLVRRTYMIRIDAGVMEPDKRTGFRHPALWEYARQQRVSIIHALLTLIRAWYVAGCPKPRASVVKGSYQEWADMIGGILDVAGIPGFLANDGAARERINDEQLEWRAFLCAWEECFGAGPVKAADVARAVQQMELHLGSTTSRAPSDTPPRSLNQALKDALPSALGETLAMKPAMFARALGQALATYQDRRFTEDGLRIEVARTEHHTKLWRVVRNESAGTPELRVVSDAAA